MFRYKEFGFKIKIVIFHTTKKLSDKWTLCFYFNLRVSYS